MLPIATLLTQPASLTNEATVLVEVEEYSAGLVTVKHL
jgi:hypothetical protein